MNSQTIRSIVASTYIMMIPEFIVYSDQSTTLLDDLSEKLSNSDDNVKLTTEDGKNTVTITFFWKDEKSGKPCTLEMKTQSQRRKTRKQT